MVNNSHQSAYDIARHFRAREAVELLEKLSWDSPFVLGRRC